MLKLGFASRWVELIMECVTTHTYSILINGNPHGFIKPSRGIRHGDPLSPYLFLLCAEDLSNLIRKAESENKIHGVAASRHGPEYLISFSLMTAYYSQKLQLKNAKIS
jgi:hypothetical protein